MRQMRQVHGAISGSNPRSDWLARCTCVHGKVIYASGGQSEQVETLEVCDDLDELFEKEDWLNDRKNRHIKAAIQREYAALTNRKVVEELDI